MFSPTVKGDYVKVGAPIPSATICPNCGLQTLIADRVTGSTE